ncbi:ABC transporter substrate-binding protein [Paenibacillus algorifonticola]|uniref:ABC transporter substrate-binding protein n=1 Tax=Paenibacillus algorifonticola TaxID=684063 RepID=UPI003D2A8F12
MNNTKKPLSLSLGMMIVCLMLVLAGCSTNTVQNAAKGTNAASENNAAAANKKLIMAYTWNPAGVDPHGDDSWDVMRSGAGETLIKLNEQLQPSAWLAKEWKQEDANTWTFKLETGVTFHDGKKMDAESVKASLLRSIESSHLAKDLLLVKDIEVLAPDELKIITTQPNSAIISSLADPSTIILDVDSMEEAGSYPAMTGAFKIKQFTKDVSLVVERYDGYWGKPAKLAEVTMKFVTDGNTRLMALQAGEVDVATDIPIDSIELVEKDSKLEVLSAPSVRTHMVLFNMNSPLFKEKANREVVDQAIPREAIIESVMRGYGTKAKSPFPEILPFGKVAEQAAGETTEQLLTAGGWQKNAAGMWEKGGKPFEATLLTFPHRPELSVMAEVIQNQLLNEGITVKIRKVENIDAELAKSDWDLAMYSMLTAHTGNPQYFLNIFYQSASESNVSHYESKPLETVINKLNDTADTEARYALAIQAQDIINADLPQSFIVHPDNVFGVKKGVTGFLPHPIEYYYVTAEVDIP